MSSFPLTNSYFSRLLKPPTSIPRTNLCLSHSLSWAVYLNMFLLFAEGFFPLVYIVIRIPDDMPGTGISKARHGKTWQDMARPGPGTQTLATLQGKNFKRTPNIFLKFGDIKAGDVGRLLDLGPLHEKCYFGALGPWGVFER